MGMQRRSGSRRSGVRDGVSRLLAGSMLASLLVAVPIAATAPIAAAGCLDKLEIETPGEKASTFGSVTLAPGETFRADIKHWTSAPNARTWLNAFNSEIRLSPMLSDGFPGYASTAQRDSFAADGPWDEDGFMNDGVFVYTNPSDSNVTSFVLEVSFWNHPSGTIVGRTEASGFSTCVAPHSPPDRPTRDCPAMPTLVANGPNVHSEPFELKKNAYISMRMVDERPLRYQDDGDQLPLLRNDYLIRTWLYGRSGPDDSWHYIRRDSHRSQNNWLRGSYVGSWDISIKNRSDYTEVKVIFGKWISRGYALSTPLDVSIKDPGESWRSVCLTSTQTTVTWDTAPSCAADNTARMQAQVRNKSGAAKQYRISLVDPATGDQVHGSHHHTIANGVTGTVALGGIPTGTWNVSVYEQQADGSETRIGLTIRQSFDASDCASADPCADEQRLDEPTIVSTQIVGPTFSASWDAVDCAETYLWRVDGPGLQQAGAAGEPSISLQLPDELESGVYCVSVVAVNGGEAADSTRANGDGTVAAGCAELIDPAESIVGTVPPRTSGTVPVLFAPCFADVTLEVQDDVRWNRVRVKAQFEDDFDIENSRYKVYPVLVDESGARTYGRRVKDLGWSFGTLNGTRAFWLDIAPYAEFELHLREHVQDRDGEWSSRLCDSDWVRHTDMLDFEPGEERCHDWHRGGSGDDSLCVTHLDIEQTDWALTFDRRILAYDIHGDVGQHDLPELGGTARNVGDAVTCGAVGTFPLVGVAVGALCSISLSEESRRKAEAWSDTLTSIMNQRTGNAGELTAVCASFGRSPGGLFSGDDHYVGASTATVPADPLRFLTEDEEGQVLEREALIFEHLVAFNPFCTGSDLHWENQAGTASRSALTSWLQTEVCREHPSFTAVLSQGVADGEPFIFRCLV